MSGCDPNKVYDESNAEAKHTTKHVDGSTERVYNPVQVEETVVHHDVERVQPVVHKVIHETHVHDSVHHKTAADKDLGVVNVTKHSDTDSCGHKLTPKTKSSEVVKDTSKAPKYTRPGPTSNEVQPPHKKTLGEKIKEKIHL